MATLLIEEFSVRARVQQDTRTVRKTEHSNIVKKMKTRAGVRGVATMKASHAFKKNSNHRQEKLKKKKKKHCKTSRKSELLSVSYNLSSF